jgi:hypothetical protein
VILSKKNTFGDLSELTTKQAYNYSNQESFIPEVLELLAIPESGKKQKKAIRRYKFSTRIGLQAQF